MHRNGWFEVDRKGLAKLLRERKGKEFVLFELIQNAWDEQTQRVGVTLARIAGTPNVELVVEDDNPEGFADLSHAFTIFAESAKKADATRRGRFNLGEKLVLALCVRAQIVSTKGSVVFDEEGRHTSRKKRERGTVFRGLMRMTNEELQRCHLAVDKLLPPVGVQTFYNGVELKGRQDQILATFTATLPTEISDADGALRRATRKTEVRIFEPLEGEVAMVYEMGIPVVETGDRWHVDVQQKVPLNFDRDNLPASYLSRVRALVVEKLAARLDAEDANGWVRDAVKNHGGELSTAAVERVAQLRFGDKRVAFDPTDTEANHIAVSRGYQLVYGSQLSKSEWEAVRRTGAILPAGRVTPSPKPFSEDGKPLEFLLEDGWTPAMRAVVLYARRLAPRILGCDIQVSIASEPHWPFLATYGSNRLIFNLGRLGHKWFNGPLAKINELLIHEFAHHYSSNHLSSEYHDALCGVGARLAQLAIDEPALFDLPRYATLRSGAPAAVGV